MKSKISANGLNWLKIIGKKKYFIKAIFGFFLVDRNF